MSTTTVTSQTNPLAYAKAIATLVGTIATALLGTFTADTTTGKVLTIVSIIATAVATWAVPNAEVVPEDEPEDDGLTYEEAGGLPFPVDADEAALYDAYDHLPADPERP